MHTEQVQRFLVIDDEPLIALDLSDLLQSFGYEVVGTAHHPERARTLLKEKRPDAVLLDINLNAHEDGIDLARFIRERYDLPFFFLTSYTDQRTLQRAAAVRPLGYLVKPFEERNLFATLQIGLSNHAAQQIPSFPELSIFNERHRLHLTKKEYAVMQDMYAGKSNRDISTTHFVSMNTIKTHIKNLYDKLEVHSRSELMVWLRDKL